MGSVVPWAEVGVGVIAAQSFVIVSYGPRGLELLRKGLTARETDVEIIGGWALWTQGGTLLPILVQNALNGLEAKLEMDTPCKATYLPVESC